MIGMSLLLMVLDRFASGLCVQAQRTTYDITSPPPPPPTTTTATTTSADVIPNHSSLGCRQAKQ
jgi:hypothetical protein